ncbi:hypothetical protein DFH06DRAFT_1220298 [Mycena polygramma]|nr:hypothetical protein DFH06DRAFT_1220298 [Mycena polygramma]
MTWLRPARGRLAGLQKFSVVTHSRITVPNIFSAVPNLRTVFLCDWRFSTRSPDVAIPWDQLTHYGGSYDTTTQRDIIMAATTLLECAVHFKITREAHSSTPIALPHLRRLCIHSAPDLIHLTTPLLEDIYSITNPKEDIHSVLPFLHRSSSSLKKLVLTD